MSLYKLSPVVLMNTAPFKAKCAVNKDCFPKSLWWANSVLAFLILLVYVLELVPSNYVTIIAKYCSYT